MMEMSLTESKQGEEEGPRGRRDHGCCLSRTEFEVLRSMHLNKLNQQLEITSLELKREIRGGVADLVSLLNELMRTSEISYG